METKAEQFNKSTHFYYIDEVNLEIKKVENKHSREQWDDFYYRGLLFLKLSDVKKHINNRKPYTPEGHILSINVLSDYKIIN